MKFEKNTSDRGFTNIKFKDRYDAECIISESSLATEDAIWFGISDPDPKILTEKAGWQKYFLPEKLLLTTQMHLTKEQVKELIPILENFVENGNLKLNDDIN